MNASGRPADHTQILVSARELHEVPYRVLASNGVPPGYAWRVAEAVRFAEIHGKRGLLALHDSLDSIRAGQADPAGLRLRDASSYTLLEARGRNGLGVSVAAVEVARAHAQATGSQVLWLPELRETAFLLEPLCRGIASGTELRVATWAARGSSGLAFGTVVVAVHGRDARLVHIELPAPSVLLASFRGGDSLSVASDDDVLTGAVIPREDENVAEGVAVVISHAQPATALRVPDSLLALAISHGGKGALRTATELSEEWAVAGGQGVLVDDELWKPLYAESRRWLVDEQPGGGGAVAR